jgi:hypothetical protein
MKKIPSRFQNAEEQGKNMVYGPSNAHPPLNSVVVSHHQHPTISAAAAAAAAAAVAVYHSSQKPQISLSPSHKGKKKLTHSQRASSPLRPWRAL